MDIVLTVLGGLGLFLFGMNMMSDSLQKTAGNRLQNIIEVLTKNMFLSIIVGAIITMLIQSSSGTTVMVIGFVNAGMMNLTQAAGVMMGANIGTTITGQLIAFNLSEYAPLAIIGGVVISLFTKQQRIKNFGDVITGIGILFIGMDMMGSGLVLLSSYPQFVDIMTSLNNPVLGILAGLILTTIVQSSSASVGMIQALGAEGLISMSQTFPLIYGANIGTTTTGLISSIGAEKTAKKTALLNMIFKIIGTLVFVTVLQGPVQNIVVSISPDNVSRQIANSHSLFNLVGVLIQLPFVRLIIKFVDKLIPGETEEPEKATIYLDERIAETPAVAIGQVTRETVRLSEFVLDNLRDAQEALMHKDVNLVKQLEEREKLINELDTEITAYLLDLANHDVFDYQHDEINKLLYIVNDLERMGDHVDNLKEITEYLVENDIEFAEDALIGLNEMFEKVIEITMKTREALDTSDRSVAYEISRLEDAINTLEDQNRKEHLDRLNRSIVDPDSGIVYLETLSNLERLADHAYNIATHILNTGPHKTI